MITGDYHHTALAVAKDVGMVKQQDQVIVIESAKQTELQAAATAATAGHQASLPLSLKVCHAQRHTWAPTCWVVQPVYQQHQPFLQLDLVLQAATPRLIKLFGETGGKAWSLHKLQDSGATTGLKPQMIS